MILIPSLPLSQKMINISPKWGVFVCTRACVRCLGHQRTGILGFMIVNLFAGLLFIVWLVAWLRWPVYQPELIAGAVSLFIAYVVYELVRRKPDD